MSGLEGQFRDSYKLKIGDSGTNYFAQNKKGLVGFVWFRYLTVKLIYYLILISYQCLLDHLLAVCVSSESVNVNLLLL